MNLRSFLNKTYIKLKERRYGRKLRYLFMNNNSDTLLVVFSGFTAGNIRRYNYIKSFSDLRIDKLFVLDPYAYRGSYYLYEDGSNYPQEETQGLLSFIKGKKNYNKVFFAGSSKGGSAALYYGLLNSVTGIFSGACQYNLGSYLTKDEHIFLFDSMNGGGII